MVEVEEAVEATGLTAEEEGATTGTLMEGEGSQ
jgi:hypothetical protein